MSANRPGNKHPDPDDWARFTDDDLAIDRRFWKREDEENDLREFRKMEREDAESGFDPYDLL